MKAQRLLDEPACRAVARRSRRDLLCWSLGLAVGDSLAEAAAAERRYELEPFEAVELDVACDVRLFPAKVASLAAKAAPHVLAALHVQVSGRNLRITAGSFQTRRAIELSIGYQKLTRFVATVAGTVQLEGPDSGKLSLVVDGGVEIDGRKLNVAALSVDSKGGGSVRLRGHARRQVVTLEGAGDYRALELVSETAVVNLDGAGDAELTVNSALEVVLEGAGNVRYRGAAKVQRRGDGAGTVEQLRA